MFYNSYDCIYVHWVGCFFYLTEYCAGIDCSFSSKRDINILRPRQNGRLFPDDVVKGIFLNENV